jgi:FkbM family methyltransferase
MTLSDLEILCEGDKPVLNPIPKNKLLIYGAGNKGREIRRILHQQGYTIDAYLDHKHLKAVDGVPVFGPADPQSVQFAVDGYTAIVAVFNYMVDPLAIHQLLKSIGFSRVIGIAELRQHFPLGETYWLGYSRSMTPPASKVRDMWLRLKDFGSRTALANAVSLRTKLDPRYLREVSNFDQYAPANIPTPRRQIRFVDGGAYDGDTLISLAKVGCTFEAVTAFEPDLKNYDRLVSNTVDRDFGTDLTLFPCGLGTHTGQVRFRSQGLSSSTISPDGEAIIQIVKFDECAPRFRPNYVKLDIEGAEAEALLGMAKTLQVARPALAVCVYHKPADLWEIPSLISDLLPDSDWYLRAHAYNGFDLVFYAVPREMSRA